MSDIDREAEPFRWCVYCDADCEVDEPEHAASCPQATGVYEVRYEAMHRPCEHCGMRPDPSIRCSECECVLGLGDKFVHRSVEGFEGDPIPVREPVCLGCAALEATA